MSVVKCTSFGAQAPVSTFTDAKTWYPGFEIRGSSIFYRDADASTVVPSQGNQPYTTRVVTPDGREAKRFYGDSFGFTVAGTGNPLPQYYGLNVGAATPLGTGNPADAGVAYNTTVQVVKTSAGNQSAQVRITPPTP